MVVLDNSLYPLCKVTYATDATTDECGDAATSYYKEFIYNGKRVIVSNNVKHHCNFDLYKFVLVRFLTTPLSKTLLHQTRTSAAPAGSLFSLRSTYLVSDLNPSKRFLHVHPLFHSHLHHCARLTLRLKTR